MLNRFSPTIGRFSKNSFSISSIKSFNFEFGLKSNNLPNLYFTNFASSQDEEVYNLVLDYYISYLNNDYSFLDSDFEMDELDPGYRAERLFDIIEAIHKIKYGKKDCEHILKMNNTKNPELHFFITRNKNNLKMLLIDLYHLGIYARIYGKSGKSILIPIEKKYRRHKKNDINLSELMVLIKNTQPTG